MHLDGVLVEADAAFAEMFGFADADEAIGTLLFDLVASDARAAIFLECVRQDGRMIMVETITSPVEFEGRVARAVIIREPTERRQLDVALREANERFRLGVRRRTDRDGARRRRRSLAASEPGAVFDRRLPTRRAPGQDLPGHHAPRRPRVGSRAHAQGARGRDRQLLDGEAVSPRRRPRSVDQPVGLAGARRRRGTAVFRFPDQGRHGAQSASRKRCSASPPPSVSSNGSRWPRTKRSAPRMRSR